MLGEEAMQNPFDALRSLLVVTGILGSAGSGQAAIVLSGTVDTNPAQNVNLTEVGSLNWAVWDYISGTSGSSISPSNFKDVGLAGWNPGYISEMSRVGSGATTTIRGGNATVIDFSYTDGLAPTTPPNESIKMVFPSDLNLNGQGVSFGVTGDPSQLLQISIWAGGLAGQGIMTASTWDGQEIVLESQLYTTAGGDGSKGATLFTFFYQAEFVADVLNFSYVYTAHPDPEISVGTAHVGITAVAVSVVPESSTLLLVSLGLVPLACRRRS